MYKPVPVIEVRIWGKIVGAVALDPKLGYYVFEYAPRFVASGIEALGVDGVTDPADGPGVIGFNYNSCHGSWSR